MLKNNEIMLKLWSHNKECTSIERKDSCKNCGKEGHHPNLCQEVKKLFCLNCNKSDQKGERGAR